MIKIGGDPGITGITGKEMPPVVRKEGKQAYQVTLKKGGRGPGASNCGIYIKPKGVFPATEARWKFKLWFDPAFPWLNTPTHRVGGKLGGFVMGHGACSGGNYSATGASYRLVFAENQGARGYLYPQLKKAHAGGNPTWQQLDQSPEFQKLADVCAGVHMFAPKHTPLLHFKMGQWNEVEMYMKLNTPGKQDGIAELIINGKRQRWDFVRFRHTPNVLIESIHIQPFFGGGDLTYAPPQDMHLWYADFEVTRG